LVIAFYSNYWQAHGLSLLKQLNSIQHEIKAHDANLLIISAEKERKLEKIAWDNNLSLSFYFDIDKEIAEKFGVYSENDPVWNRFSGIDINVPLLATYVISPFGKIAYDHIDWDFSSEVPSKEIIAAVSGTKPLILNT
jgi:peroxiredoxin